ncbi:cadherin-like beta sandwich domain-containing protein [Mucilaginibacter sp.]|uniref:cadherin-like beta sandwich domain-containing protein n=1 Tax=Mucilaginibacter sp. TaxID=1882438 RepID=UPI0032671B66
MNKQLHTVKNLIATGHKLCRAAFILAMLLVCARNVHARAKADTLSGNNNIRIIRITNGTFDHPFDPAILNYKVTLPAGTEFVDITFYFADSHASYFSNYDGQTYYSSNFPNGVPVTEYNVAYGAADVYIPITAENGAVKTYHLQVAAEVPDSKLSILFVSKGTLSPAFSPDITNYDLEVPPGTSPVTITPVAHDPLADERIGTLYGPTDITTPEGYTNVSIIVTAQRQLGTTVYKIKIKRPPLLTSLPISAGTLSPAFNSDIENYTVKVPYSTTGIKLAPLHNSASGTATIKVNGTTVSSGTASPLIPLVVGANNISTVVTTSDGVKKTYTVNVTRVGVNDVSISIWSVSPGLLTRLGTPDSWATSVSSSVNSVRLTIATINAATIKINGVITAQNTASAPITLTGATTTIPVELTLADGVTKRLLTVTVNKAGSNDTGISYMAISPGKLTRVATTDTWTTEVSSNLASVELAFGTKDPATIKVNGVATAQSTLSAPVALSGATTTVPVEITAEDGITKRVVTILVKKGGGFNTGVNNLAISNGTIFKRVGTTDIFDGQTTGSSYQLTIGTIDPAYIYVYGANYTPQNTPSMLLPTGGSVSVLIAAEDGVTKRWITIYTTKVTHDTGIQNMKMNPLNEIVRVGTTDTFTAEVENTVTHIGLYFTLKSRAATMTINNVVNLGSTYNENIPLMGTYTTIPAEITADDGVTKRPLTFIIHRLPPPETFEVTRNKNNGIDVVQNQPNPEVQPPAELTVHQSVSPNGDGINDRFTIDGITAYPQNTVSIINRNGQVIYATKGYNNYSNAFDGHAANGTLQQPGTYFYSVEYKKGEQTLRKTGYVVVKY